MKEQQIEKKIVECDKFAIYPYFLYGEMVQVLGRHLQRLTFQSKIVYRRVYRSLRFLNGFKNIFAPFRILRKKKKRKKEREKEKIVIPKSESNKSPLRIPD